MVTFNNANLAQNLGLLTTGVGLLEGQGFGQAVQGGLGAYTGLSKLEDERRRREAMLKIQADLEAGRQPSMGEIIAADPKAATALAAQSLTAPKIYGDPTKGMYTYEINPATGRREIKQVVEPQGLGLGSGFQANVASQLFSLGTKIQQGDATPDDQARYRFLAEVGTKPSVRQIPNPDGTVSTIEVPGIDLAAAGLPAPTPMAAGAPAPALATTGERELGKTPPKFSQGQQNAAGFARRMRSAEDIAKNLTSGEGAYDPTNIVDFSGAKLPPELAGSVVSDTGKQYEQAKRNFLNSQLRFESGAAISESEYANAERQYYPIPGDDAATIEQKRRLREDAIAAMVKAAGGAYGSPSKQKGVPAGALLIREMNGVKYYKLPDGSIKAID